MLEDMVGEGGKILDYHGCDFFPERWIDIVIVLTAKNDLLYDRLAARYIFLKLSNSIMIVPLSFTNHLCNSKK